MTRPPLYLASRSPRRKMLLERLGWPIVTCQVDTEENIEIEEAPERTACRIAEEKMAAALQFITNSDKKWILTADTFIHFNGKNLGKPLNRQEGKIFLQLLSGETHRVITGVALHSPNNRIINTSTSVTEVRFGNLSEKVIEWYLDTGEWRDAAGSYKIQENGEALVFSINGSYSNVMGLPLNLVYGMMQSADYPVI